MPRKTDNNFYSDENYRRLQKIVALFDELNKSFGSTTKDATKFTELYGNLEKELAKLGVVWDQNKKTRKELEESYRNQYNAVKAIKDQHSEILNIDEEFNLLWDKGNDKHYKDYQKLNQIKRDAQAIAKDLTKSEKEKTAEIQKQSKAYNDLENKLKQEEAKKAARKSNKEAIVGSIFGTSSQDIQDVKDGTYGFKFAVRVFGQVVDKFKKAVENGIEKNYNSTEATLNRITASNSNGGIFGWSKGNFSFGGRSYTGYKQINNAVVDRLSSDGLYDNISNTQVMEAMAKLTSEGGFGLEQSLAKAYQDTVINYLVPYLDTSTEAFNNIEMVMPRYI